MATRRVFDESSLNDPAMVAIVDDLPLWSAPFGLTLLDLVRLRRGITAVDIGSGMGFPAIELAERLGASGHVHAIDPWQPGLDRLRAKLAGRDVTNVTAHTCGAERLPFEDASIDLITSNNGFNNVSDFDPALGECARVARPGAQLVYAWNLPDTMHEFYDVLRAVLGDVLGDGDEASRRIDAHIDEKRKPVAFVRARLDVAGFDVERVVEDCFELRFIDGAAMFDHFLIRTGFAPAWVALVEDGLRDRVFDECEARLDAMAAERAGLTLSIPFACLDATRR